jgi:hypothetical protein
MTFLFGLRGSPDWPSLLDELVYPFVTMEVFTEICFDGLTFTVAAGFAVSSSSISKLLYEHRSRLMIRSM